MGIGDWVLKKLPDLSRWDTQNDKILDFLFECCES